MDARRDAPAADPLGGPRLRTEPRTGRLRCGAGLALVALIAYAPALQDGKLTLQRVQELGREIDAGEEAEAAVAELLRIATDLEPLVLGEGPEDGNRAYAFWLAAQELAGLPDDLRPPGIEPLELLRKASRAAAPRLGPDAEAWPLYHVALQLRNQGALGEARQVLQDTIDSHGDAIHTLPSLRITLARMEKERGSLTEALELAEQAEGDLGRIAEDYPDRGRIHCELLGVFGEIYLALGLLDRAAVAVGGERDLAADTKDTLLIAKSHIHTADLYAALRRHERLVRHVDEALESEALKAHPELSSSLVLRRGLALAAHGRKERELDEPAERDLREVLRDPHLSAPQVLRARSWLAVVLLRGERLQEAGEVLRNARTGLEEARRGEESAFAFQAAMLAALETQLLLALEPSDEALREQLDELERDFGRFLDHWRTTPVRRGGVGFLHYGMRRHILSELIELTLRVEPGIDGVAAALDHVHRAQAMGSMARASGYEPLPLEELWKRLVDDGTGLLVYMPGPESGHLFALDADDLIHERLDTKGNIEDATEAYVARISVRPDPDAPESERRQLDRAAADLAGMLLPKGVQARMKDWSGVTVVGLDVLGYLPFEYLPLDDGRRLGEALAVCYLPSLPVGVLLQERPDPLATECETDLYLVAAPEVSERVSGEWPKATAIPFDDDDEERLTSAFDRERVEVVTGPRAGAASLLSPKLASTRVLQILAHGVYLAELEQGAALALAPSNAGDDDGLLLSDAVLDLPHVPPLVVLAACEAARGPLRRGEDGVAGIGGAFLTAGGRAVVLSPSRLELNALYELMPVFYERLVAHGDSPAEALRRARIELAKDPRRSHPFYGLIHVVGLGHEPVFPGDGDERER